MCKSLMKRKGHGHLFCSAFQFGKGYKLLPKVLESPDDVSDEADEKYPKKVTDGNADIGCGNCSSAAHLKGCELPRDNHCSSSAP